MAEIRFQQTLEEWYSKDFKPKNWKLNNLRNMDSVGRETQALKM